MFTGGNSATSYSQSVWKVPVSPALQCENSGATAPFLCLTSVRPYIVDNMTIDVNRTSTVDFKKYISQIWSALSGYEEYAN